MPLSTGTILQNRYRIVKLLGQGGFGAVYRAWDVNLKHPCAVKENLEISEQAQRQFNREAMLLANLSHPNLPRVTDYFFVPDQGQYLVMDYVEGQDLQELLDSRSKPFLEKEAIPWIVQVSQALAYLHTQNPPVIHRDIKPSNIKLSPNGQAILVDFGIAKIFDLHSKTTMGARAVTPGYSPVEQYGQGKTDARTDIYALGATLYHLLTAQQPTESIQRSISDTLAPAEHWVPNLSPGVAAALHKALRMNPDDRFQSASEFSAALAASPSEGQIVVDRFTTKSGPFPSGAISSLASHPASHTSVQPVSVAPLVETQAAADARTLSSSIDRPYVAPPLAVKKKLPWLWIGLVGGAAIIVLAFAAVLIGITLGGGSDNATPTTSFVLEQPTKPASAIPITPTFTPLPQFRSPDPLNLVEAVTSEPSTLDPALNYESVGIGILMNIYETLVYYHQEGESGDFIPQLATEWTISQDGKIYTFNIRQGVRFHDGSVMTPSDVAYSFQRGLLQGGGESPQWMLAEPMFGVGIYDISEMVDESVAYDPEALRNADPAKLKSACELVVSRIVADDALGTVTFYLEQPWAPFLMTLAQPVGAVLSNAWVKSNGGWDGSCNSWQNFYGVSSEEINETPLGSSALGTGPYFLDHWTFGSEITLSANLEYWRTEPAWEGGPSGIPEIKGVHIKIVDNFDDRLSLLQSGEADVVEVTNSVEWSQLEGITGQICQQTDLDCQLSISPDQPVELIRYQRANYRIDLFMNWQISPEGDNTLIGSGELDGSGIPPDFFNDVHVRRAFAYCFDYTGYAAEAYMGEGIRSISFFMPGMIGFSPSSPYYGYDLEKCAQEFQAATLRSKSGKSLWDVGFKMQIAYNSGNKTRETAAKILQATIPAVNAKFIVEAIEWAFSDYYQYYLEDKLPVFSMGWIEDIHDPHNWVVPYILGAYASHQNLPIALRNQFQVVINQGVAESELSKRALIYQEFNQLYYENVPAILLFLPVERIYQQRWVRRWYSNPAYPGTYYYALGKD